MATKEEPAADAPGKHEPTRFRFTLTQLLVVTAACAVCLGVGSWTGDFILWPPLVGVILLLTFRTQGGVTPGLIFGFTIAMGILVILSLPNPPDKHVKILAFGALGAAWGGGVHSIVRGHSTLGWTVLFVLGCLTVFVLQPV